jgi:O-antigen ligase
MNYWKAAADIFRAHPWIGLGPKNYDRRIVDYLTLPARYVYAIDIWSKHRVDFWQHLHNIYLQMLVEYGAIGLILWALAFSILCLPLFQPSLGPFNMFQIAFQISGIAFLIHNGVDILFVNSFDLVVAIMLAQLAHASRTAAHLEAA